MNKKISEKYSFYPFIILKINQQINKLIFSLLPWK